MPPLPLFSRPRARGALAVRPSGLTMVEVLVSMAVLAITAVGGVSGFMLLNQHASAMRNLSSAKALCQERIEQVQTMPFVPPTDLPSVSSQLSASTTFDILGSKANYDTTGKFSSTTGVTTSNESVQVYVQQDGTTATVTGTRTTTVTLTSLSDGLSTATAPPSLKVVSFTVNVAYTFRGKSYSYSMYTLRSPD